MPRARPRILIVEDDATLASFLARLLVAHGSTVEVLATAETAEERLARGPAVSLVLLDVNLPGDSGWSLFRHGSLGGPTSPPTIVTSAVPVSPARLREFRVADYLPKPFAVDVLLSSVARLADDLHVVRPE